MFDARAGLCLHHPAWAFSICKGLCLLPFHKKDDQKAFDSERDLQTKGYNKKWLVVSTHLKNISQNGNLPQIGMKIKNIKKKHHLALFFKHARSIWVLNQKLGVFPPKWMVKIRDKPY